MNPKDRIPSAFLAFLQLLRNALRLFSLGSPLIGVGSAIVILTVLVLFGTLADKGIDLRAADVNTMPVASVGSNQTVPVGQTVILDGSASSDVDGDRLTFSWSIVSVPDGSVAARSNLTSVNPTFEADQSGTYTFQLVVNDGTVDSDPATVEITTENSRPEADAGRNQSAIVGETIILDGRASSDVDGDSLKFTWSLAEIPDDSATALSDPASISPRFNVDVLGSYVAQLVVSDSTRDSISESLIITTGNSPPVADAGPDQSVTKDTKVNLDGTNSTDVDGDRLTYFWSFTSIPQGSIAVLSNPTIPNPDFVVDLEGTYIAQLLVSYIGTTSLPAMVTITTGNSRPVADAGSDQSASVGNRVSLDGSGSSDADSDPLDYFWSLTRVPIGSAAAISESASVSPTFDIDLAGTYVAQLIVTDGLLNGKPSEMVISTVNSRPVANAGADQVVVVGDTVLLDGSGSSDVDRDLLTYRWSLMSRPLGSAAGLLQVETATPSFVPDIAGIYVTQLNVYDGSLESEPHTVKVTIEGLPLDPDDGLTDAQEVEFDADGGTQKNSEAGMQSDSLSDTSLSTGAQPNLLGVTPDRTAASTVQATVTIETPYRLDIIAQTGMPFIEVDTNSEVGTIVNLGSGPSINDSGKVAFTGRIQPPEQGPDAVLDGVFIGDSETVERRTRLVNSFFYNAVAQITRLDRAFAFGDVVQINNQEQIVWRVRARDGLFSFILRLGQTSDDFKVVAKNFFPRIDNPPLESQSPFSSAPIPADALRPWVTLNNRVENKSRVIFSGILKDNPSATVLSTPANTETGGHDFVGDFRFAAPISDFPAFFPLITDDGKTMVRGGAQPTAPLTLFVDETLKTAIFVAATNLPGVTISNDFNAIGQRPGISDDGRLIAFAADHKTQGVGIYVSSLVQLSDTEATYAVPTKIAGGNLV